MTGAQRIFVQLREPVNLQLTDAEGGRLSPRRVARRRADLLAPIPDHLAERGRGVPVLMARPRDLRRRQTALLHLLESVVVRGDVAPDLLERVLVRFGLCARCEVQRFLFSLLGRSEV